MTILLFWYTLSLFSITTFAANDAATRIKWGYEGKNGPSHWGQLDPSFALCEKGKLQSPINIQKKVTDEEDSLLINYQPTAMLIMDNGPTYLMIGDTPLIINEGHSIQLNFPKNRAKENITFNGKTFRLVQLHLHTPSETKLRGKSFPLEIHFVHQGEHGTLAVIAVFVKTGDENMMLNKMINNLPATPGKPELLQGERIDPSNLLPDIKHYFSFTGSLTSPPCSEGVKWIVMEEYITASEDQINSLKEALHGHNARPVQSLNQREIQYSIVS
jgi:carbonic anhydrase